MSRRRRSLGLARGQVAERSGISPGTLARMEKGIARITLIDIEKVARALGVTSSDLVRRRSPRGS